PTPPPPLTHLHSLAASSPAASTTAPATLETTAPPPAQAGALTASPLPQAKTSDAANATPITGMPVSAPELTAAPPAPTLTGAALTSAPDKVTPPQAPLAAPAAPEPEVAARAGHVGHATGVAIAKRITAGGEELTVRLNPAEFGKVEVRMAFDDRGTLRAVIAVERPEALELLRRDSADLTRAVVDAGIRADQQSFRFDARSGGGDAQGFWQRQQQQQQRHQQSGGHGSENHVSAGPQEPAYQQLRTAGRVNLMA
ncbi:flagellar hook-length control protein FliK, partial [Sphingomonas mucosissima]